MSKKNNNFFTIGGGWKATTKKGQAYLSLSLNVEKMAGVDLKKICIFPNKYKKEEKHPDYVVMASKKEESMPEESKQETGGDFPF